MDTKPENQKQNCTYVMNPALNYLMLILKLLLHQFEKSCLIMGPHVMAKTSRPRLNVYQQTFLPILFSSKLQNSHPPSSRQFPHFFKRSKFSPPQASFCQTRLAMRYLVLKEQCM